MRITVMGVLIVIGGVLLLAFVLHVIGQDSEEPGKTMTNPSRQPSEWLTAAEAAQYLKVKVRTLLFWVRQGKVKAFALSGTQRRVWRFRQMDLDAALMESSVLPSKMSSVRLEERMEQ